MENDEEQGLRALKREKLGWKEWGDTVRRDGKELEFRRNYEERRFKKRGRKVHERRCRRDETQRKDRKVWKGRKGREWCKDCQMEEEMKRRTISENRWGGRENWRKRNGQENGIRGGSG